MVPDAEITLEANPDSACDVHALRELRSAGFNRISLGMQSADSSELKNIGRIQSGCAADLLVLDKDLNLKAVFVDGKKVV